MNALTGYDAWLTTTPEDEQAADEARRSRRGAAAERLIDGIESYGRTEPYLTLGDIRRPDGSLPPLKRSTHQDDFA